MQRTFKLEDLCQVQNTDCKVQDLRKSSWQRPLSWNVRHYIELLLCMLLGNNFAVRLERSCEHLPDYSCTCFQDYCVAEYWHDESYSTTLTELKMDSWNLSVTRRFYPNPGILIRGADLHISCTSCTCRVHMPPCVKQHACYVWFYFLFFSMSVWASCKYVSVHAELL